MDDADKEIKQVWNSIKKILMASWFKLRQAVIGIENLFCYFLPFLHFCESETGNTKTDRTDWNISDRLRSWKLKPRA